MMCTEKYGWITSVCITLILNVFYYDDSSMAASLSSAYASRTDSITRLLISILGSSKAQHIHISVRAGNAHPRLDN